MAVTVGSRLGPHQIISLLGKGGMGEVYRARDTRLNRDVAIKLLPDVFANDPERIARFHREAQSVAALNHPNIAAIYDLEEADGAKFLVLELVEGETLADILQRGPLPPDETLNVAHQICEALEAAHEKGVIHRDLKPANVKITPEGKVKVLDFGLAKAMDGTPASGVGTAHYSFSDNGSLIYVPGPVSAGGAQLILTLMDRKGTLEPRKVPPRAYDIPRVSPDGKQIAFGIDDGKDANVWIYDLAGTTAIRQLTVGGANRYPIWSADNQRVAFQSDREGDLAIFWQRADGSGTAERLTKPEKGVAHIPDSWSPDGQRFSFSAIKGNRAAVWIFSLQDKKESLFAQMPSAALRWSAFSPDGHWLAYQSNETGGRNQIWVQPFPATEAKFPVTFGGHPFWSPDGKELFYNSGQGQTSVVSITTRPTFSFGVQARVPDGIQNRGPSNSPRGSDITPDGKYFVGTISADQTQPGSVPQIQVVINWFEDLKQRMSTR